MRSSFSPVLPMLGALLAVAACSKPAPPPDAVVAPTAVAPAAPAADEVPVYDYSSQEAGDWHASYQKWAPTVVFEAGGHYYPHDVAGARSVQVYQYQNRYFMPPRDKGWAGTDKRLDPKSQPSDDDYRRARTRP